MFQKLLPTPHCHLSSYYSLFLIFVSSDLYVVDAASLCDIKK
jgi:hypothetical protein